jgi:hypothetical protein
MAVIFLLINTGKTRPGNKLERERGRAFHCSVMLIVAWFGI